MVGCNVTRRSTPPMHWRQSSGSSCFDASPVLVHTCAQSSRAAEGSGLMTAATTSASLRAVPGANARTMRRVSVGFVLGLSCRECARTYPAEALHVCEFCFGPLEVAYDQDALRRSVTRDAIASGPPSIWRYADLLPVGKESPVDLGAGFTPLIRADRLAAEVGLGEVWVKDDTRNPTGSFKDRVVSVALTKARRLGFKVAACASTGNLANSVAAHAARAGMASVVLIPYDLETAKVIMTAVYGGTVVAVEGSYDDVNRLCAELTSEHPSWAFVNVNVRTYYAEGSKTLAFEVAEQLGWRAPDHVVAPVASGSQLVKVGRGFRE